MSSKTKNIIGWVLTALVSFVFIASGFFKLKGGAPEMAQGLGGETNMMILGILEFVMVILFLIPRTGIVGALLMMAYMGGAMAVHLTTGKDVMVQTIIQCLIWITSAIRFPEIVQRLITSNKPA
jgi:uncharacterized membrane protein YphA (DoxX/SURF4 family)